MKRLPRYLNIEESKKLLGAIDGEHRERDFAIITLFLNCGLRLSELVGINLNRIKNDILTVVGKGDKERTIYLNAACKRAIEAYLKVRPVEGVKDKNALFLSERKQRISNKTVQHIVKKYITAAGLDPERYSTHKLRHTAATLMYKHGKVDIRALQEILGHESIATTEIYTHVDNQQIKTAVESNPLSGYVDEHNDDNDENDDNDS
jgi:integrase/recombinase XerD